MLIYVLARRSCFYPDFRISGYPDIRITGYPDIRLAGWPDIRISAFSDIRIPGIPENPRLTNRGSGNGRICSIWSIVVVLLAMHEYVLMQEYRHRQPCNLHILAFPEPRFVNLEFSGNPEIRMSGNADIRISGCPDIRISGYPEIRKSGFPNIRKSRNPDKSNFDELLRKWPFC